MKIIQTIEDIDENQPYLVSGRVINIKDNTYTIGIKYTLAVQISGNLPNIEVDDYISVILNSIDKIAHINPKTYIISSDFSLVKDIKVTLQAFRQHCPHIRDILDTITDPTLLCIMKQFLHKEIKLECPVWNRAHEMRTKYHIVPSARTYHHAYIGGNLIHSIGVAQTAYTVALSKGIQQLPLEILVAGSLLHDIGKLEAFTPIKKDDLIIVKPTNIRIKEHIDMGLKLMDDIYQFLRNHIPNNDKLRFLINTIKGFIATHHGLLSWGAKREPDSILENILFISDYLDSRTGNYNPLIPSKTDTLIKDILHL